MNDEVLVGKDEDSEDHTVGSRKQIREQLQSEIDAFLARGGTIEKVDSRVSADPPQKPANNYCSRPI